MSIPDYQQFMLPLMKLANDGQEHRFRDAVERLSDEFNMSPDDRKHLLPSGTQRTLPNRIGWASTYLKKAGLLQAPKRGYLQITDRGRAVLEQAPDTIDRNYLQQFEEFMAFQAPATRRGITDDVIASESNDPRTPEESLEYAYDRIHQALASEILERIKAMSPDFFETLVVELLVAMGYGGSLEDAGEKVGGSRDGGIDGIIKEDRLGLDVIYIQAKRWENTVGRPEIQKFVGALQGKRARKGVFITTSGYSKEAEDYAQNLDSKVVLIDGDQLARHMIDSDLGVSHVATYTVKKVDTDYFTDE
jgi:restriction system protein